MTRQDYIAGLEEIRKQVKSVRLAYAAVDLTDATNIESERYKKTKKLIADLTDRLYEDIAISAKVAADNAEAGIGEQGDLFDGAAEAEAAAASEAETGEVIEVQMLPAPKPEEPADDPKPAKKSGKGKGGKGKKNGKKKGGAK